MSDLNIKLGKRKEIITVKEVVERYKEHAAGLPAVKIIDIKDREHVISYLDCVCILSNFDEITEGSQFEITIVQNVSSIQLLPKG